MNSRHRTVQQGVSAIFSAGFMPCVEIKHFICYPFPYEISIFPLLCNSCSFISLMPYFLFQAHGVQHAALVHSGERPL